MQENLRPKLDDPIKEVQGGDSLLANFRLGRNHLSVTNALAFCDPALLTAVKTL
jgi:hypothetical protein